MKNLTMQSPTIPQPVKAEESLRDYLHVKMHPSPTGNI